MTTDVWLGDALSSTGGRSAVGVLSIVTATRNGVLVPLASSSRPESTCSPSASAPVAKVTVEPDTVGAGAGAPSSMPPVTTAGSLVVRAIEVADVETEPSCGDDDTSRGAVLSNRTPVRTEGAEELPNAS